MLGKRGISATTNKKDNDNDDNSSSNNNNYRTNEEKEIKKSIWAALPPHSLEGSRARTNSTIFFPFATSCLN